MPNMFQSALLGIAVKTLSDGSISAATITKKDVSNVLKKKDEILFNTIWRMLRLRGYIDEKHQLTLWGKVLNTILTNNPTYEFEEPAIIAVELARLGLLNAKDMFTGYSGAPHKGTDIDKRNTLLVSRIASLGKLKHQDIGYTGPLSRHLLGYNSMITAIRNSLRDLTEVCVTTLMLNGDATRDVNHRDWNSFGLE
jgi:hypothetical protein